MTTSSDTPAKKKHRKTRDDARERLLDAAEFLFAEHGFHAVPVRDIIELAGTRLADISDHFGGKEGLFKEVITRRAALINADRVAALEKVPDKGRPKVRLKAVVEAFARPILARSKEGAGWGNYLRLIAQVNTMRSGVLLLIADQFNPMASRFIGQMSAIFPEMTQRQLLNAYQFMLSATLTVFSNNYRVDSLSSNAVKSSSFDKQYEDLLEFVVGGIARMGERKD